MSRTRLRRSVRSLRAERGRGWTTTTEVKEAADAIRARVTECRRSPSCSARALAISPARSATRSRCRTAICRTGRRRASSATKGRLVVGTVARQRTHRGAGGPLSRLRRARPPDGHLRGPRARAARRQDADPDQRRRRHNTGFSQGALMVIDDHINLIGDNPLVGDNDDRFGPRFPDMTEVYSSRLRAIADRGGQAIEPAAAAWRLRGAARARATKRRRRSGICGRSAPTRSACRPCPKRSPRATWASRCSASRASPTWRPGVLPQPLDHDEVMETARRVRGQFIALLEGIIGQL